MDMVWAASDGLRREIFFSTRQGGTWSQPVQITYDNADNVAPSIDTSPDGTKFVVWTAIDETGQHIRYATCSGSKWSAPSTVPGVPNNSTGAFISVDKDGIVWIAFAGNDDGDDDIYTIRMADKKWSKISLVHADNDAPDIDPFLEVSAEKTLQVFWEGFREGQYLKLLASWTGQSWLPEERQAESPKEQIDDIEAIEIPVFVEDKSMLFTRSYQ
ncbi:MAG: hypothetical protein RBS57_15640 [Desulforhabdus sp.]|nr:hypothetical protein [Desulforhabdus sp.]